MDQKPKSDDTFQARVVSPDGHLKMTFLHRVDGERLPRMFYQIDFQERPVILESELDIRLDNHLSELALGLKPDTRERWCENLIIKEVRETSNDSVWQPPYGEKSRICDNYRQTTIHLVKDDNPTYELHLIIRAYNEGIAFRYFFPEDPKAVYYQITAENTQFTLPPGTQAYFTNWAQGAYTCLPLKDWPDRSERPLTLQLKNGLYVCLAEAEMVDYARTHFALSREKPDTIVTSLYSGVDLITPFGTPWRVVMVAEKPGDLIENNHIILNLNPPCAIDDTSWIKPGKVIRDMTVSTRGAKACVDFAVKHKLQYVEIDWGWYGVERIFASDARKVDVDPRLNPNRDLDLPEVIRYAKANDIGIIVYVNQRALLRQIDEILPLYQKWGLAGVKFGFVQVGSHRWTTWLHEAVKKAAAHRLLVDVHDEYRPTGFSRTYPNLLTQEGIRGNEEMPDATHNTTLPFTRYIAGAADYTICYYKQKELSDFHGKLIKTTSAHQLALAVVYYSPLQFLFWYDKPSDCQDEPEIEFFEQVPAVWDETRVLAGEVGQYIATARRSGEDWFVGIITNNDARELKIPLGFLPSRTKYIATIYSDDPSINTRTHVSVRDIELHASQTIDAKLLPSGGMAILLKPRIAT
ncbi:MAG TPA: glycoside hydrolase family 97 catalytic domain-containing protein [Verrucomicrobiae bacterium]|nr:glycoside hydrolase family 97 catalytic domain-containing protein [Verrucomicrobiae bacterium]